MNEGPEAILLAAGASSRMGTPKALLPWHGRSMVRSIAEALRDGGVSRVVVVVAPGEVGDRVRDEVRVVSQVSCVVNPYPERGMLTSVHCGIAALGFGAFLVCPCDLPRLTAAQVRQVISAWDGAPDGIVVPYHRGEKGHPTLFGPALRSAALALDPKTGGLNRLLKNYPITETTIRSDGPFFDADTPGDWAALQPQE